MAAKRITERVAAPFTGSRVDREAGTISGVLICGTASANGRDYPAEVLRRDYRAYENRPVNADHGREATVDRRLGWFTGVAPGDDGRPRGTLHLLKSHPLYERVMEAAERNPALYGFSHVAMCDTRRGPSGREVVEAIRSVESIDLVAEPATTNGFFEGKRTVPGTIKQVAEALARHPLATTAQILKAKRLAEMDDMGDLPVDAVPDEATDPDQAIDDAFRSAMHAQIDALIDGSHTIDELVKKIKALGKAHGGLKAGTTGDEGGDEGGGEETPSEESRKGNRGGAILEALEVAEKAGLTATREDLELIAAAPADRRQKLAERLKRAAEGTGAERVTSAGRKPGASTAGQKVAEAKAVPTDPKAFAASVRE